MPRFSNRDQQQIQKLTWEVELLLRTGLEWNFALRKPHGLLGGEPWRLVVNNRGAGVIRGTEKRWAAWPDITSFGVWTIQSSYLYMTVRPEVSTGRSMNFPGTSVHDQVILAVLQHIHERKVGRYIYPRLKPTTVGDRLIGIVAEWDRTFVPEGVPMPIVALPGFEKKFAASNE